MFKNRFECPVCGRGFRLEDSAMDHFLEKAMNEKDTHFHFLLNQDKLEVQKFLAFYTVEPGLILGGSFLIELKISLLIYWNLIFFLGLLDFYLYAGITFFLNAVSIFVIIAMSWIVLKGSHYLGYSRYRRLLQEILAGM